MVSDATWAAMAERYSTEQLLDAVFAVGQYHLVCFALKSCGVPLDAGVDGAAYARLASPRCASAMFVTCVVDLFEPDVGVAAVQVLRAGGCEVSVPERPDVLRAAGLELGPRGRGGQGGPHDAGRPRS